MKSFSLECNIASIMDADFAIAAPILDLPSTFSASQLFFIGLTKIVQSIKANLGQYATLSFCLFWDWLVSEWTTSKEGSCNSTPNAQQVLCFGIVGSILLLVKMPVFLDTVPSSKQREATTVSLSE